MKIKELATRLGIEEYPEAFEKIYNSVDLKSTEHCDISSFEKLEAEYNVFGDFYPALIDGINELAEKPDLLAWCNIACEYLKGDISAEEARATPMPVSDGSPAGDMLMMAVLASMLPRAVKKYKEHGLSHDETAFNLHSFYICMNLVKMLTGRPGINRLYFGWLMHYALCYIFNYKSLNFEMKKFNQPAILLKKKDCEEFAVMMTEGRFHRSGQILGSAGYTDEDGAFDAEFSETDTAFTGHLSSERGYVSSELTALSKNEWECAVREGDSIISLHIPRNTDLSYEALLATYKGGLDMLKRCFPEHKAKYLFCYSWIIDSRLRDLLGEKSKVVGFGDTFRRFPVNNTGREGKGFIFFGSCCPDEELPETTSLQRKVKELYINGGYTYASAGFVTEVHL